MKRWIVPGLAALAASFPALAQSGDIAISLGRAVEQGRPLLTMTVANRSTRAICLLAELLRNPDTGEIAPIGLRDARGRAIEPSPDLGGYIAGYVPGVVRVAPGEATRARYYLDWRFEWPEGRSHTLPRRLSAQVTVRYHHCDGSPSLRARSRWQPI